MSRSLVRVGALYCLMSAAAFGAMAIFAKLAYAQGVTVDTLMVVRFGAAAVVLLALARWRGALAGLDRRSLAIGFAMGAVGYAAQAGLYFAALTRIDASLVALLFSTYPLMVMVAAVATRRERASVRRVVALALALFGVVLVLGGGGELHFDGLGALLAVGSGVVYTAYILVGDRAAGHIPPLGLAALVCTGGFTTSLVLTLARGGPGLGFGAAGWGWLGLLVLISTVGAILLFFAGLALVGPTVAALLGVLEPVVTVGLAALVFGEALVAGQAWGAVVVLAAVLVVQWPSRSTAVAPEGLWSDDDDEFDGVSEGAPQLA